MTLSTPPVTSTDLAGKKAVVTGGSRGIGRQAVLALARAGADVITCHRTGGEHVDDLARELAEIGGDHYLLVADIATEEGVAALVAEVGARFGSLDVLVNNAGVISHIPFAELSLQEWRRVIDTNLTGAFYVTQQLLPLLGSGSSVINVGSKVATVGIPLRSHYTAAKAGLVGLTRSMCKELGPRGIRVNVVAPGVTATEVELPAELTAKYESMTALRRLGGGQEIASVITFLAGDASAYVTGETINVDGGI